MVNPDEYKTTVSDKGFAVIDGIFSPEEIKDISETIQKANTERDTFRRSADLFAIRQLLKEVPGLLPLVFNEKLRGVIRHIFGEDYFIVKSIYFDKPEISNWYVAWHQDLTISVDQKLALEGFGPWTMKQNQFAVQPPLSVLESNFTVRIHLDNTEENNGALKVIEGSHLRGIYRPENIAAEEPVTVCNVPAGGIMIMKPLLMHSSGRTVNHQKRRVLQIEFSNTELPAPLKWSERGQITHQKSYIKNHLIPGAFDHTKRKPHLKNTILPAICN